MPQPACLKRSAIGFRGDDPADGGDDDHEHQAELDDADQGSEHPLNGRDCAEDRQRRDQDDRGERQTVRTLGVFPRVGLLLSVAHPIRLDQRVVWARSRRRMSDAALYEFGETRLRGRLGTSGHVDLGAGWVYPTITPSTRWRTD